MKLLKAFIVDKIPHYGKYYINSFSSHLIAYLPSISHSVFSCSYSMSSSKSFRYIENGYFLFVVL